MHAGTGHGERERGEPTAASPSRRARRRRSGWLLFALLWLAAVAGVVAMAVSSRDEQVARTVDQLDGLVGTEDAIVSHRLVGEGRRAKQQEAADCSREYIPGTICASAEDRRRLGLPEPAPLDPITQSTLPDPPETPFIAPDEGPVEANPTAQLEQTVQLRVFREDAPPPTTDTTTPGSTATTTPTGGGDGGDDAEVAGRAQEPGPGSRGPLPRTGGGWLALTALGLALIAAGWGLTRTIRERKSSSPA